MRIQMRISRNEYNEAEECLKRYKYNCRAIKIIPKDLITMSSGYNVGIKAPNSISDPVFNNLVRIQENKELQRAIIEYNAVENAILLLTKDEAEVFESYYIQKKTRSEIADEMGLSDRSIRRRHSSLIYKVHKELKKLA